MRSSVALRRPKFLLFPAPLLAVSSCSPLRRRLLSTAPSEDQSSLNDPPEQLPDSSEKPKLRRPRLPVTVSRDLDPVQLPDDLDILWTPSHHDHPRPTALPPPENFDDALNKLLITLHPQTQHRASYTTPLGAPTEPTLALYSPIEGGDYIIDATVAELARRTGAEVLVLDAVQLAAGEWGHFGPAANSLSLPRNPLHFPSSPLPSSGTRVPFDEGDESESPVFFPPKISLALVAPPTIQGRTIITSAPRRPLPPSKIKAFFDAVVNIQTIEATEASQGNRPRLIYIRDFPTLAASSSSWYPPLLSAVRDRRKGPISRPSSPVSNPTTIIFGMTPSLIQPVPPNSAGSGLVNMLMNRTSSPAQHSAEPKPGKVDWSEDEAAEKAREKRLRDRLKKWESSDAALIDEFPKLSMAEEGENGDDRPEVMFFGFSGLPSSSSSASDNGQNHSVFFRSSILIPKVRSVNDERAARISRRCEINELTVRMGVGAAGGILGPQSAVPVHVEPSEVTCDTNIASPLGENERKRMWEDWGNRVEVWSNVRKIADRAIGATIAATGALPTSEATLAATVVPWSAVYTAWAAHRSSKDLRSLWLKEAFSVHKTAWEPDQGNEASAGDVQVEFDEVIERVKNVADLDAHEQKLLGCIVDAASMPTSFAQVHLPSHTIDSVRTIVSLPLLHPRAFQQGILKQHSMTGCLLFGPPGTGKTLVVRALAKEAGCRMLSISPSDVMDMYVGEGEKLVRAVFSLARRLSPCVIFLDEIDALFGARMSGRESGSAFAHRGIITEFMQEMDGLKSSKEDSVIVIGATNRPFDLDDAVLRRLPRRLLVDLPGEKERQEILKILLRDESLAYDLDIRALARKTESFSGSDLKHLCVSAALDAVKEGVQLPWVTQSPFISSTHLQTVPGVSEQQSLQKPSTDPTIQGTVTPSATLVKLEIDGVLGETKPFPVESSLSLIAKPSAEPHIRVLHPHNFAKALKEITPSSSESLGSLAELRKWNDEFGEGRRDKKRQQFWGKGRFGFTDKSNKEGEDGRVVRSKTLSSTVAEESASKGY